MEDTVIVPATGLSEIERVVDTFVAPSKTFTDILRSGSWWLPFAFMVLVSLVFTVAIDKKVGFDDIATRQIEKNHFAADRLNALPADQRAEQYHAAALRTKHITYGSCVIILLFGAIISLLWWATINFGFGGSAKFSQIFAVWMYASLPKSLMALLAAILLFAGVGTENFDVQNPVGTNIGYYMPDSSAALKAALGFFDLFGVWSLLLAAMGVAIVARKTMSQAAIVVVGWWLIGMLLTTASAAIFS